MVVDTSAGPLGPWRLGGPALSVLSLLASIACSTNDAGSVGDTAGAGGSAAAAGTGSGTSGGGSGAAGSGGTSGAASGSGGGGSGASGGTSHQPAGGAGGTAGTGTATGGAGMGGAGGGMGGAGSGGLGGAGAGGSGGMADTVTRTASTFTFRHFPVETNSDGVWNGPATPAQQPTSTTFETTILENGYLRVTLLPEYGGRILSIVHKPTNRELLYQNPLGTPYLMQEGIFYYDYLVILGGIFPSFPEPEHGKYWNQPYAFDVVSETTEAITVRMSRSDDRDVVAGIPEQYDVGRTDVLVQLEVTLRAGSTALELDTKLTNTRSTPVPSFEYWTVTTLAPGSTPGETAIPLDTRILAKMDRVRLLESSWPWFGTAEERVSGEVFEWNNLSYFTNWVDQGTAFANPDYRANWSGLANYENDAGILRVSDNVATPGLKLWTFGKESLNIDINDSNEWLRPTIEMWHGVTPEFWARGTLSPSEVRTWSDRYFPTLGLREITAASEYGALQLSTSELGAETVLSAAATLVLPNQTVKAILRLGDRVVAETDVVVAAAEATTVSATLPSGEVSPGAVFAAEFLQGSSSLLSGQTTLE